VLLGAMSLLGLVGLLHRDCAGSSPSGLGAASVSTPRGTQTRRAPNGAWRVRRLGDHRPGPEGVSNALAGAREAAAAGGEAPAGEWPSSRPPAPGGPRGEDRHLPSGVSASSCCNTPLGYRRIALRGAGCGAIFRDPRHAGRPHSATGPREWDPSRRRSENPRSNSGAWATDPREPLRAAHPSQPR
jgi:hypothetical protein